MTTTSTGSGGISTATVTTTATPDGSNGLDDGAKAGLAIGIILAVLLFMFIGYKMFLKYRANRMNAAATTTNGDIGLGMGGAAGAAGAIGAAAAKFGSEDNTTHAYKSELNGESRTMAELDPRSISELDTSAAVAVPRTTGVHRQFAELDPDPPTQLSELPADNYDPTLNTNSLPPAYVSPMTESGTRNTLYSTVSPVSPDSSTMQSNHGLGISSISEGDASSGANSSAGPWTNQTPTVQQGFGRGWLPKER
ncbi:uncharacterized protein ColSpa_01213 [Colletotrichum spaethianum]|uniref:Uncharacterized protein n=1 Tax=Colletotrichum spaethianum TaxID=700344 RepID=A0AA37NTL6_9PEZI|nr:uncharacterized protein ColSpa_01213 [Colletotrichum spaethianum]GKT41032.1 hypothetical protein ColSpa_01213 [Colletotrichum spaethianum]